MAVGVASSNKKVIIIATVICGSLLAIFVSIYGLLFWRSRKERYQLILGAEQSKRSSNLSYREIPVVEIRSSFSFLEAFQTGGWNIINDQDLSKRT